MASLTSLLPAPTQQVWDRDDELKSMRVGSALVVSQTSVPPYGQRKGWVPRAEDDFGDGGAFPEIHVAQYPLSMGARGKESTSNALAVQLDETGKVKYSAIARQGHGADKIIYSKLTDLLPSEVLAEDDPTLQKPSDDDIADITEKTKLALEKLTNAKISAALPVKAAPKAAPAQYIRYTPAQQGGAFNSGAKQRVIRMVEAQADPMEPPRFQINKKIPRAAPSPPAPVLHSPPRRVSVKQQRDWKVPPCVSHWKNAKGNFQINKKIPRAAPSPPAPVLHSPPRRVSVKQQRDWKVPPCVSHWKNAKGNFQINKKIPRAAPSPPAPVLHSPPRRVSVKQQRDWKVPPCVSHWKNAKGNFQINKKIPRAAPSPPAPVLHSPPRRVSVKQQRDWKVPPCVSHWKNAKGYTIPLDKRLAADGRGLQQVHINENFSKLAEALYIADRKAREAVEARAQLERRLAQRDKEKKEEHLRMLAQRARDHRAGIRAPEEEAEAEVDESGLSAAERDKLRADRHKERQRDRNLARAAPDKRSKLVKDRERDISEQIALGLPAKTTQGGEAMFDQRLFNNSKGMDSGYADDEAYNVYDKPWRNQDTVGAHIYRPSRGKDKDNYGDLDAVANTRRFVADKEFSGTTAGAARAGPVQFERDAAAPSSSHEPSRAAPEADFDPFGLDRFLSEAKRADKGGRKRDHERPDHSHQKRRRD